MLYSNAQDSMLLRVSSLLLGIENRNQKIATKIRNFLKSSIARGVLLNAVVHSNVWDKSARFQM